MKTFDEFMREGGIFVEILSSIPVWQVIRHMPGEATRMQLKTALEEMTASA